MGDGGLGLVDGCLMAGGVDGVEGVAAGAEGDVVLLAEGVAGVGDLWFDKRGCGAQDDGER